MLAASRPGPRATRKKNAHLRGVAFIHGLTMQRAGPFDMGRARLCSARGYRWSECPVHIDRRMPVGVPVAGCDTKSPSWCIACKIENAEKSHLKASRRLKCFPSCRMPPTKAATWVSEIAEQVRLQRVVGGGSAMMNFTARVAEGSGCSMNRRHHRRDLDPESALLRKRHDQLSTVSSSCPRPDRSDEGRAERCSVILAASSQRPDVLSTTIFFGSRSAY